MEAHKYECVMVMVSYTKYPTTPIARYTQAHGSAREWREGIPCAWKSSEMKSLKAGQGSMKQ